MLKDFVRNDCGMILPTVLCSVLIVALIVVAVLYVQRTNVATTNTQDQGAKIQFLAEYGARSTIARLTALDATYRTNTNTLAGVTDVPAISINDDTEKYLGQYVVKCYNPLFASDQYQRVIDSNSEVLLMGSAIAARALTVNPVVIVPPSNLGNYVLFSDGDMTIVSSVTVEARNEIPPLNDYGVASNGLITSIGAVVEGEQFAKFGFVGLSAILPGTASVLPFTNGNTYSAEKKMPAQGDVPAGSYYMPKGWSPTKSKTFTTTGKVIVYVVGNVVFDGNVLTATSPGTFAVIATGTVTFNNSGNQLNRVLVVTGGPFTLNNGATLTGAVVTGISATISNNGFTYDASTYQNYPELFNYHVTNDDPSLPHPGRWTGP
ncbi:MAG: hypothetical protein WC778_07735 [Negativicutes bacterium]